MAKNQRAEEILTNRDRHTIHELYYRHLIEIEHICERYGIDENALKDILAKEPPKLEKGWRVRWDDHTGTSHSRKFETFSAAKEYHAALHNTEWSKIERV